MNKKIKRILIGLGVILITLILGYLAMRPFYLNWGASREEIARAMPGDLAGVRWTRAISIRATPEQIYPWLVQFGQGRGGWYSYDWLENLLGFDIHTADRILPEFQNPKIGDPICMSATACPSKVIVIEPNQWFGWQAQDDTGKPIWTFMFGLFPVDETHTRLVARESFDPVGMPAIATFFLEVPDVVMGQKALNTLKQRAEGAPVSGFATAYEIAVWLASLIIGLAAGVFYIIRKDWKPPLAVGIASVIVLLTMTLLYPPYWLRGVLVVGLLAGLVWALQKKSA